MEFNSGFKGLRKTVKKKSMYQGTNGSREYSEGNKTVPGKVVTTRTEDGHKQNIKTSVTI